MGLAPQLAPTLNIVAFRAPRAYGPGFSWFDIQFDAQGITFNEAQAQDALGGLIKEIEALPEELQIGDAGLFVGGFSQGAAMTMGVLMTKPDLLAGAVILSGRMANHYEPNDGVRNLPVLVQHGLYDNVIPVENGRRIASYLTNAGAQVQHQDYPMAHEVSMQSLTDLKSWLDQRVHELN